jgi:small subunit ribosomal protein S7
VPRKGSVPKRDVLPDPVYGSTIITKLTNNVMLDGKKGVAQDIVYNALKKVEETSGQNALDAFMQALSNVSPTVEVKARRVGGANYQVPIEVRPERRQTLGLRWLVNFARKRKERTMTDRLAAEILDALNNTGGAAKRREEMHRTAEANKAFAHFRY